MNPKRNDVRSHMVEHLLLIIVFWEDPKSSWGREPRTFCVVIVNIVIVRETGQVIPLESIQYVL